MSGTEVWTGATVKRFGSITCACTYLSVEDVDDPFIACVHTCEAHR